MALYEQVKDFIARKIQEGVWRAGDRLPSESELVAQFGISRMTVNRALRELVIPFGASGYVALFEIVESDRVIVGAVRHQREDDYH